MKKSLIALAVAGAFAAPAFAATENVDVYGKLHMSVSLFSDQQEATAPGVAPAVAGINDLQISSNASRIGFKGAEDLGGGLSAIWQVESSVNLDEQTGSLGGRNSFVGLKGGFGTALLGNHDTPLKLVGRAVDLFGDTMADSRNVMGGGSDTRAKNVVAYITPDFSGFGAAIAYSTDLDTGKTGNAGDLDKHGVYNLNVTYKNDMLFLGLGYGDGDGHEALDLGAHVRLAAGLTFGNFKVVGQYDMLDDNSTLVSTMPADYTAYMVGGAYTMGNVVLKANYMAGEYDTVGANTIDPEQWTIGADYNLSKRSSVYALYASGTNVTMGAGAGSSDQVAGAAINTTTGLPVTGDRDISVFSVGVVHNF